MPSPAGCACAPSPSPLLAAAQALPHPPAPPAAAHPHQLQQRQPRGRPPWRGAALPPMSARTRGGTPAAGAHRPLLLGEQTWVEAEAGVHKSSHVTCVFERVPSRARAHKHVSKSLGLGQSSRPSPSWAGGARQGRVPPFMVVPPLMAAHLSLCSVWKPRGPQAGAGARAGVCIPIVSMRVQSNMPACREMAHTCTTSKFSTHTCTCACV